MQISMRKVNPEVVYKEVKRYIVNVQPNENRAYRSPSIFRDSKVISLREIETIINECPNNLAYNFLKQTNNQDVLFNLLNADQTRKLLKILLDSKDKESMFKELDEYLSGSARLRWQIKKRLKLLQVEFLNFLDDVGVLKDCIEHALY